MEEAHTVKEFHPQSAMLGTNLEVDFCPRASIHGVPLVFETAMRKLLEVAMQRRLGLNAWCKCDLVSFYRVIAAGRYTVKYQGSYMGRLAFSGALVRLRRMVVRRRDNND